MVPHNSSKSTSLKDFQLDLTFFDLTILPFSCHRPTSTYPCGVSSPFLTPPFSHLSISRSLFAVPSWADMGADSKVFTLEDVYKHNNHKDCWLLIGGKVYDVTRFMDDHPGGDEVLLAATGKDASDDFEDIGHSSTARAMMDEYLIGEIDASTIPVKIKYAPPKQPHYNQDKTSEFVIKLLQFLVPLIILGVAVGIRFYTKSA